MNASERLSHSRFIAEDRAARDRTGRIDCQHRDFMSFIAKHVAERLDQRRLARAGHARDAEPQCFSGSRKKSLQNALRLAEVFRIVAFDQSDRAREDHSIAARHALDKFIFSRNASTRRFQFARHERGIDVADGRVFDAVNAAHHDRIALHRPLGSCRCIV